MTVSNDAGNRYYKEKRGNFRILVKSGTKRIVLIIKGKFQDCWKIQGEFSNFTRGSVFCTIVLQKKSPVIKFPANKKKASLLKDPAGDQTLSIWTFLQIPSLQLMEDYILVRSLQASGWLILEARQT